MSDLAPSKFRTDLVQNFVEAADFIAEKGKPVVGKVQLLSDLKLAISYRKKYSVQFREGGDEGHNHFVSVLNYCYHTLKACPGGQGAAQKEADVKSIEEASSLDTGLFTNRFLELSMMDEEDDNKENDGNDEAEGVHVSRPPS